MTRPNHRRSPGQDERAWRRDAVLGVLAIVVILAWMTALMLGFGG